MNIPKWTSSGLMPCPSAGAIASRARGLARNTMTPSRNANTSAMMPVAYGDVYGKALRIPTTAMTAISENTTAMYSIDPAFPA